MSWLTAPNLADGVAKVANFPPPSAAFGNLPNFFGVD
jgi:hypothetical protein